MKYFSANGILGRGAIFNQVYSDRSDGKTFDIKYRGLQRFIKNKYTTVYVRRWKTEFSSSMKATFLGEVLKVHPELDIYDITYDSSGLRVRPKGSKKNTPWEYMFYFVPISVGNKIKSNFDITNIREIDFDEYVPLDGRYAPDEMINLIELYRTCDRDRNIVKLCTFGNRITESTPFLNFFDIHLDVTVPKIRTYKDGTVAVQVYMNMEHREAVAVSPISRALEGTIYNGYLEGDVLQHSAAVIRPKPKTADIWARFKTVNGEGSIWTESDRYYVSDREAVEGAWITDKPYGIQGELVATYGMLPQHFRKLYRTSCLYATSDKAWYNFQPIFDLISLK